MEAAEQDPDAGCCELRVHGVAGTPPEQLLETGVVDLIAGLPRGLDLHRARQVPRHRRAFSWGALTSGRPRHAFNVLLLPFMLANVGGWMLPILARPEGVPTTDGQPAGAPAAGGATAGQPATPSNGLRFVALLVRLHGFVVTAIFALFVALAFLQVVPRLLHPLVSSRVVPIVSFLLAVATLLALGWFTKVRPRDPDAALWGEDGTPVIDQVGSTWLDRDQDRLWATPQTAAHLHRAHVCFAIAIVTVTAGWAVLTVAWGPPPGPDLPRWTVVLAYAACVASVVAAVLAIGVTVAITRRAGTAVPAGWSRVARRGLALVTLVAVAAAAPVVHRLPTGSGDELPAVPGALTVVALMALVLVVLLGSVGSRSRPEGVSVGQAWNGPVALLLAAGLGTVFGAGLLTSLLRGLGAAVAAVDRLRDDAAPAAAAAQGAGAEGDQRLPDVILDTLPTSLEWVALAFTMIAVVLLVVGVTAFVRAYRAIDAATPARHMVALRSALTPASTLLATLGIAGAVGIVALLLVGTTCVVPGSGRWPNTQLVPLDQQACLGPVTNDALLWGLIGVALVAVGAGLAGLTTGTVGRGIGGLVVVAGLAAVGRGLVVMAGWDLPWLTTWEPLPSLATSVTWVAFVLPVGLVVGRMLLGGFRDRRTRRGVAVLWDVATFWPRWFHPFAQRSYSDTAVTELSRTLQARAEADEPTVLAPHSQGSVLAATAILHAQQAGADLSRLALLTYGSPLGTLYREAFPAMFPPTLTRAVATTLSPADDEAASVVPRWRNLWRSSDPIGGAIWRPGDASRRPIVDALSREDGDDEPEGLADTWKPSRNHSNYFSEPAYRQALEELWSAILPDGQTPPDDPEPQEPKPPAPGPTDPPDGELGRFVDYASRRVQVEGSTFEVLSRQPYGPARARAIVLHELPGATPALEGFANRLVAAGVEVHVPLLFGTRGAVDVCGMARGAWCLRKELAFFTTGRTGRLADWLHGLVDELAAEMIAWGDDAGDVAAGAGHASTRRSDVRDARPLGVVGMCMTGGIVLATMAHPRVTGVVASQPSLPLALPVSPHHVRANLGISAGTRGRARGSTTPLVSLRYRDDWRCPDERIDAVTAAFTTAPGRHRRDGSTTISTYGRLTVIGVEGKQHAVLTADHAEAAVAHVVAFLRGEVDG
jgi:dienelactone hydrolase